MKPRAWALSLLVVTLLAATPRPANDLPIRICDDVVEPVSLNPYTTFSEKSHSLMQQVLEGLLRFDADGNIQPSLATEWRRINGTRTRFKIRPNVVFHDGTPLTPVLVKRSLDRYLDPATKFPGAGFISSIDKIEIVEDGSIDIVTRYPDGLLLNRLAAWIHICPVDTLEKMGDDAFGRAPVGTGPFAFESWNAGRITLRKFDHYWDPRYPRAAGVMFEFLPVEEQIDALLRGDIDILTSLPGTRTLDIQKGEKTYVMKKPSLYTVAGSFNISRPPLSNKKIRQALNMAVNKDDLVRYDLLGNGRALASFSSPGEFGHNPDLQPYPFDPERVRQILAEEGYPHGFTLKVFLKVNAERTGRIIAHQLEKVGVTLDASIVSDADIFKNLQNRDQWDMLLADCPDPMYHGAFIPSAFLYSKSPFAISANAEFDHRLENVMSTLDPERQRAAMQDLDRYIHDEALALFTYQRIRTYGVNRAVRFTPYRSGMHYFFSTARQDIAGQKG